MLFKAESKEYKIASCIYLFVFFYKLHDGNVPILEWNKKLENKKDILTHFAHNFKKFLTYTYKVLILIYIWQLLAVQIVKEEMLHSKEFCRVNQFISKFMQGIFFT